MNTREPSTEEKQRIERLEEEARIRRAKEIDDQLWAWRMRAYGGISVLARMLGMDGCNEKELILEGTH